MAPGWYPAGRGEQGRVEIGEAERVGDAATERAWCRRQEGHACAALAATPTPEGKEEGT